MSTDDLKKSSYLSEFLRSKNFLKTNIFEIKSFCLWGLENKDRYLPHIKYLSAEKIKF